MLDEKSRLKYTIPVVLCLSLAVPLLLSYVIAPFLIPRVSQPAFCAIIEICFWAIALGVMIAVRYWERQPFRSIGFRSLNMKEGLLALSLGIVLLILAPALTIIFIEQVLGIQTKIIVAVAAVAKYPIWVRVLFAARPCFVEEILYRGYWIERLRCLTGRIWPGAVLGLIIFTALHLPNGMGIGNTVGISLPIGTILTGLYVWKRNLTLNIFVHFLIDFLVLVYLPLLLPL